MADLLEKKVCLITHPYSPTLDTGRALDRVSYELSTKMRMMGVDHSIVNSGNLRSIPATAVLDALFPLRLLLEKADVYHSLSELGAKSAIIAKKRPLITTVHDTLPFEFTGVLDTRLTALFKLYESTFKIALFKSDMVIVPFQSSKDFFVRALGIPPEKVMVVPYGVDHSTFYPEKRTEVMTKRIFFLGEALRQKGVDTLIKAFAIVEEKIGNVELMIGSDGRHMASLKKMAQQMNVGSKVTFLGHIPEENLRGYYNTADVFAFPSRYGFGLPLLEAMACGTPVIAGNRFDAPDFVEDAGLLVDPDDTCQLADALIRILSDKDLTTDLSRKGIAKARDYSWEKMVKGTLHVYDEVISI